MLASRTMDDLRAVALEVEALGGQALCVETNIRDVQAVDRLAELSLDRFEAVDFVVNNAGGQFQANPFDITDNGWRAVVDLNLNGTWNVCSRFMPHLMERQQGSIVNIVHRFVFERGAPMFAHSGAARAGVVNLTRSLAPYLEARNVTINAVAPGDVMSRVRSGELRVHRRGMAQPPDADPVRGAGRHREHRAVPVLPRSPHDQRLGHRRRRAATQTNWPSVDEMLDSVSGADDV